MLGGEGIAYLGIFENEFSALVLFWRSTEVLWAEVQNLGEYRMMARNFQGSYFFSTQERWDRKVSQCPFEGVILWESWFRDCPARFIGGLVDAHKTNSITSTCFPLCICIFLLVLASENFPFLYTQPSISFFPKKILYKASLFLFFFFNVSYSLLGGFLWTARKWHFQILFWLTLYLT